MRVLALDLGTSSVRARVADERAEWVGDAVPQRAYDARDGLLDPDELVAAAEAVAGEARRVADEPIAAVGASCFWHSLLLLDGRDRPLTPVLTWREVRAAPQAAALRERLDAAAVHARTGCPLHPSFWPAKLAWLRERRPELWRLVRRFVTFPDYLLLRLTGELHTSLSQASATGLHGRDGWDAELLEQLGVRPEQLPEVSDAPAGDWFPAYGDGACSNVGTGCLAPDRAALMLGTSGALRVLRPDDDAPARPGLFRLRLDAGRVVEGGSLSDGGGLHAWLERTLRLAGSECVAEREPAAHGLSFLPFLGGERSPGWRLDARGAVLGLTYATEPGDLLQAAYEGVAYRFAEIAELLPEVREVVGTGAALARNPGWAQILADVLERPVHRGVPEGSARGAAVLALERLGATPPAPAPGEPFLPRRERAQAHRAARERQRELYDAVV